MKYSLRWIALFLVAILVALLFRLPRLQQRTMHGDEAVHAIKFGELLERGYYQYDPVDYHGPTLNYLTLIPAWLFSQETLEETNESTLRLVPVFFGVLLVVLILVLADGLTRPVALAAALFTAISPAMVFYSRYYIQEMLLVCLTFAVILSGYRYTQRKNISWAILTGIFMGLAFATKETSIIAFGSMALALLLILLIGRKEHGPLPGQLRTIKPWHLIAALAAFGVISILFYSSFFTYPAGILKSVSTYGTYFSRAGDSGYHNYPWYYYLKMLIYSRYAAGPAWSEAIILLLAVVGILVALKGKRDSILDFRLLRFLAIYTVIMTVLYSLILYKTPWNLLSFWQGMILLAGVGAIAIVGSQPTLRRRMLVSSLLVAGGVLLGWQSYQASYKYYEDPANPYVYAHPVSDVVSVARQVEGLARAHADGRNMYVQVIWPENDYWPLPWYLRSLPNIGWWDKVEESIPAAPVILASPDVENDLMKKLYEQPPPGERDLYLPLSDTYEELRAGVEIRGYVKKELWDRYQQELQSAQPNYR
jgi:uncharacterized protein (TIGR03663 family)